MDYKKETKMKRLIKWHKDVTKDVADHFGLSMYQVVWISFVKGVVIGYLVATYLG
jgi:hypothetical protein